MLINIFKLLDKFKITYNRKRFSLYTKNVNKINCLGNINLINKNIKIGKNVTLYPNVSFEGNGIIELGDNVKIGTNTVLYANKDGGLKIGSNTIIAANNYIIDSNHNTSITDMILNQPLKSKMVYIGSDVWIGTNCSIVMGAKINDGVVIGANSLVNKEITSNSIAFGTPAKEVKERI